MTKKDASATKSSKYESVETSHFEESASTLRASAKGVGGTIRQMMQKTSRITRSQVSLINVTLSTMIDASKIPHGLLHSQQEEDAPLHTLSSGAEMEYSKTKK
ncbi:hypothetical protein AVEN_186562-1 [Araneus ventricosus]|uniref:Uncharacterized protein n=1 Tax=Araneus ventricosus TaxID=182803 RepID=A0A4Y2BR71_ARAVE|nr:hypothetical protein AVEN_147892-1 [Araneus ventricosus]GBL94711.1 hypothetical protein AVEN_186562-1 [Araneus ventricosus]